MTRSSFTLLLITEENQDSGASDCLKEATTARLVYPARRAGSSRYHGPLMTRSLLAFTCLLSATLPPLARAEAPRPNFIVINIDDLGYADIGPFGSTLNRTPHLDRMAAEGMKLKCH